MSAPSGRVIRTGPELTSGLERLGVPRGGLVMFHSSLRSIGTVEGGADRVVDALLAAIGPEGTLVAPTFTGQYHEPGFVFDPAETPVTTGAIPNHVFRRPEARRTIHIVQTVAAIGPLRDTIIDAGGDDGWDAQPSMRAIFDLDGWFLLLGVPYQNLTAGHFMEQEIGSHRRPRAVEGLQRLSDGRVVPLHSEAWGPDPSFPGMPERSYDFNRLGEGLEQRGLVKRGAVGNAIARLFRARDLERTAREMFAADPELFFIADGRLTPLQYGVTWTIPEGRHTGAQLCVVDPAGVYQPHTK
ncbi:MAG: AAC(3) family N-acetyltransferase [Chloroflexi bacterium]|nr:AAC(3) family N-acetyltransferase [Chloroflexota bacterium]